MTEDYYATLEISKADGSNRVVYKGKLLGYDLDREPIETYSPGPWKEFAPGPILKLSLLFDANSMEDK